jgi:addiction module HigA family antidote
MAARLPSPETTVRVVPPLRRTRPPHLSWPVRRPPHPGEFLQSRFLAPLQISQTELAAALHVSRRRVNELVNGRRALTPDTAVRLAAYFGSDAAFWMHLQVAWDMHGAVHQVLVRRAAGRSAAGPAPPGRTPT